MTRVFRFFFIAAALFVLLLLAIGLYFRFFFDPNDIRDRLGEAVEKQTGRALTIEGDLDLHYFPWVGVSIGRTRLGEDPAFGSGDFVSFESASARVKVLPLLSKQIEVGKLTLDGLNVNLIRNAQGEDNWATLASTEGTAADAAATADAGGTSFSTERIGGLDLTNATIVFDDRQAGTTMTLSDLGANTGPISRSDSEVALAAGFDLAVSEPDLNVRVDLSGNGRNDDGTIRMANPQLRVSGNKQVLSEGVTVDQFLLQVTAPALAASAAAVNMPSPTVTLTAGGGSFETLEATVKADSLSFDVEADMLTLPKPDVVLAVSGDIVPAPVDLTMSAESLGVSPGGETLSLASYVLEALGVRAGGSLNAKNWSGTLEASGPLDVDTFSARDLLQRLNIPFETADSKALSRMALKGNVDLRGDAAMINDLTLTMDDSTITGRAGLSNMATSALDFDIAIDQLNADGYLAPTAAPAEGEAGSAADAIVLPAETLRELAAKGALKIGAMTFSGIESTDVEVGLNARNGNVRVFPSKATLYGGTYSGDIRIDATGAEPRLSLNENVAGIDFNAFAATVMPDVPVHGTLTGNVLMSATGETTGAMKSSLNGTTQFEFANGYVDGIDLWNVVQGIVAVANKAVPSVSPRPWRTDFERLRGQARVVDGVVQVEEMVASVPHLDVTGGGQVNLNDDSLAMRVQAEIVEEEGKELLARERSLVGFEVPVVIGGTIDNIKPDTAKSVTAVVGQLAKRALAGKLGLGGDSETGTSQQDVDAALDAKKEEVKDKIDDKAKDLLRGLFGRDEKDEEQAEEETP